MKTVKWKVGRDATTGRFIKVSEARKWWNKCWTVVETMKRKVRG